MKFVNLDGLIIEAERIIAVHPRSLDDPADLAKIRLDTHCEYSLLVPISDAQYAKLLRVLEKHLE